MPDGAPAWWRNAVIYQLYPKSFADGNADGYGDFKGVLERLPYLADLGIDAIWFCPFFKSPQHDGGYDVSDYRDVEPLFGDLADLRAVIDAAHSYGIRIIADIVPNHSSSEHEWFRAALQTPPPGGMWDRFHCVRGRGEHGELPPNNWGSVTPGNAWQPIEFNGQQTGYWYLHIFDYTQPDLNWEHPAVWQDFDQTLRFWFDLGIDGFRIDVAHGLFKADGYPDSTGDIRVEDAHGGLLDITPQPYIDQPRVHDVYRHWRKIADEYLPERIFVAEAWVPTAERLARYLRPDELHTGFNFGFMNAGWDADRLRANIDESLAFNDAIGAPTTWVTDNHDVSRSVTRYAVGMREVFGPPIQDASNPLSARYRPSAAELEIGRLRSRAALLLMLALPGSAYIWQGQELGLEEVRDLDDRERQDPAFLRSSGYVVGRDGCRVPIPWTQTGSTFGFSAEGVRAWLTQPRHWGELSVAAELADPNSMLTLTKRALRLRKTSKALNRGGFAWRNDLTGRADVLAFIRETAADRVVVVANFGPALEVPASDLLVASRPEIGARNGSVSIPTDSTVWLRP